MTRIVQTPRGLNMNASRQREADAGHLETADDVVIRRPGVVSARPGFGTPYASLAMAPYTMKSWDDDFIARGASGGGTRFYSYSAGSTCTFADPYGSTAQPTGPVRTGQTRDDALALCETVHGDLLCNSEKGVLRQSKGASHATLKMAHAGAHGANLYVTWNAAGSLIANNSSASYAAVLMRKLNGREMRTAAFGITRFTNTVGAARDADLTVYLPYTAEAGDTLEVYRSKIFATGTPDLELALIKSTVLTSTDISNKYYAFTDSLADASRGAAAYFSTSRSGLTEQNFRPPSALRMASFNGSMFYGDIIGPYQKKVTLKTPSSLALVQTDVTTTTGLNTATVASATGLEKGMILFSAGSFTEATYITAISGLNITLSTNATATGTTAHTFSHAIRVGSEWYKIYYTSGSLFLTTTHQGSTFSSDVYEAQILYEPTLSSGATIIFSEIHRERTTQDTIRASGGTYYDPPLNNPSDGATTGFEFQRDAWQNGLAWSKFNEPEAVPLPNYTRVGAGGTIEALETTRDALYILKSDGIWRLSGVQALPGGKGWRIDLMTTEVRCLSGRSVAKIGDDIYFLSNKGVARIRNGTVVVLPSPDERAFAQIAANVIDFRDDYDLKNPLWSWGCGNPRDQEYVFGYKLTSADGAATAQYVFNAQTEAWTRWTLTTSGMWHLDTTAAGIMGLYVSLSTTIGSISSYVGAELIGVLGDTVSVTGDNLDSRYDDSSTKAVSSCTVSGTSATLVIGSAFVGSVSAGDVVLFANDASKRPYRITAVNSSTNYTIDVGANAPPSTGNVTWYKTIRPVVQFAFTGGDNTLPKAWSDASFGFDDWWGPYYYRIGFESTNSTTATTHGTNLYEHRLRRNGTSIKSNVPQTHATSETLLVSFEPQMALGNFELTSCAAEFTDVATAGRVQ